MTVEMIGKGTKRQLFLNGTPISRKNFEIICKEFFSTESWLQLLTELEQCGRVHLAFVFTKCPRSGELERANKKIAALEKKVAQLTIQNIYLQTG